MSIKTVTPREIELRGEIVELLERGEWRAVRLALDRLSLLEIPSRMIEDPHLGDSLRIRAHLVIESIHSDSGSGGVRRPGAAGGKHTGPGARGSRRPE